MSGEGKRSDGLLGERNLERDCALSAPPVLDVTAPFLDSTWMTGSPAQADDEEDGDES